MKDTLATITKTVIAFTVFMTRGFTLKLLWNWIIASKFQLQQLTLTEALGVILFFSFVIPRQDNAKKEKDLAYYIDEFIETLIENAVVIAIAYILTLF